MFFCLCLSFLFNLFILLGVDRLDKDLTIGQMQGKKLRFLLYWTKKNR